MVKTSALAFFLVATFANSPLLAQDVGAQAPSIEPQEWLNNKRPVSWKDFRGRVILVDLWATWCGPCIKAMPHLNKLHEDYAKKGLVIVGISNEPPAKIRDFLDDNEYDYLFAAGGKSPYVNRSIPHVWLISARGEVVWRGHPAGLKTPMIEAELKSVVLRPQFELPKDLKTAEKYLNGGQYAKAIEKLDRYLQKPKSDASAAAARTALKRVKSYGSTRFKEAKALAKEREYGFAMEILDELAIGFKGTKLGDNVKAVQKEWKSDKEIKVELTAASMLAKAVEFENRKNYKSAYQVLLQLTKSKKYGDTKAASEAQKRLRAVKKKM